MTSNLRPPGWRLDYQSDTATLVLTGDWIARETGLRRCDEIRHILDGANGKSLRIDGRKLGVWDSALIAFLMMLRGAAPSAKPRAVEIDQASLPDSVRRLLALAVSGERAQQPVKPALSVATVLGIKAIETWGMADDIAALVGETAIKGAAAFAFRTRARAIDVFELVLDTGAKALGIVAIVNGLVGAILAFVGAVQLQRFGAQIYIANLVGIAVVREMAAMVTAIVMAGRTGGSYAAQLASMQGNEEIDALHVFGVPVFDFLVLPRIIALVAMMPLLYLYACAVGLAGGLIVSIATADLSIATFLDQLRSSLSGSQFAIGLTKSVSFGALIALSACHIGLNAGRSAADVGQAATSAVVAGIVGIIALDAIFAVCTNALGI